MTDTIPNSDAPSSTELDLAGSCERAVNCLFRGVVTTYVSAGTMAVVVLAQLLGPSITAIQQVGQPAGALLPWIGCLVMGSATRQLRRFGARLTASSLASFAGMGVGGLLALVEMF